jgi:hypothetical protein
MSALQFLVVFNPTSGAAFNVTLPAGPVDGEAHRLKYVGPYAGTYPITVLPNTGQTLENGSVSSVPLIGTDASLDFVWSEELGTWIVS